MKRIAGLFSAALAVCFAFVPPVAAEADADPGPEPFIGVCIDFREATDEELEAAAAAIRAEQQARLTTSIELNYEELTLKRGASRKLKAKVMGLKEGVRVGHFRWTSSDPSVVTVSGSTVKAVDTGEAEIICSVTLSNGLEVSNICSVTAIIPVSEVTARDGVLELGVGKTAAAPFTVEPDTASKPQLTYASSDEGIVRVDETGTLTGTGAGTATVTATSSDGTEKSASVTVKVTRKDDVGEEKTDPESGACVRLTGFRQSEGTDAAKPARGNVFVYPAFEIINGGKGTLAVDTEGFSKMCDGEYVPYSFNAVSCEVESLTGTIEPGAKRTGEIGIEVPQKWKELTLTISFGWYGEELSFLIFNK